MSTPKKSSKSTSKASSARPKAPRARASTKQPAAKGKPDAEAAGGKKVKPTTPDSMSADVIEFITAIDDYKRTHQRPFPNWSEVLDIVKALGYSRD